MTTLDMRPIIQRKKSIRLNKNTMFLSGILGVSLFLITTIVGGFLIEDYSMLSQFISETYAVDTKYGYYLRFFGFIPSGILIAIFSFLGMRFFKSYKWTKIGFVGVAIFYGLATVLVSIFPCDSGCNKELIDPTISQLLHNLIGALTYVVVPPSFILIGMGLKRITKHARFANQTITLGIAAIVGVFVFISNTNSQYIGLYQRLVELLFIIWIATCAIYIKNSESLPQNI